MTVAPADHVLSQAVLRPVRGHHAFEGCVEQLATAIRLGVYADGDMLPPERELADRLGVSRASLREAIAALRTAGLVRTQRGRGGGTVVSHTPPAPGTDTEIDLIGRRAELLDSLEFRRVVEPGAAHRAATRTLTAADRQLLESALADVADASDEGAHRLADSRLHLAIASASGSPMLMDAVTRVQRDLHDMLSVIPVLPTNIEHSTRQHAAIVRAVVGGRPTNARRTMEIHCDDTAALLRGLLP